MRTIRTSPQQDSLFECDGPATRRRSVVLVDAGWFIPAAAEAVTGRHRPSRESITVETELMMRRLTTLASRVTGAPCSGVRWYDGVREDRGMTTEHQGVAAARGATLCLGALRSHQGIWEQKRVDAMIQRDMTDLARRGVASDIVLISGDEDLVVAVECAREAGANVDVWDVEPRAREHSNASPSLLAAGTRHVRLTRDDLVATLTSNVRELPAHRGGAASAMAAMASQITTQTA